MDVQQGYDGDFRRRVELHVVTKTDEHRFQGFHFRRELALPETWNAEINTTRGWYCYILFRCSTSQIHSKQWVYDAVGSHILLFRGLSDILFGNYDARRAGAGIGFAHQCRVRPGKCMPEDVQLCAARGTHVCDFDERKLVYQPVGCDAAARGF